jgi:hypothetical protein
MSDKDVDSIPLDTIDFERWGRLIKTWATGTSYFEDINPQLSIDRLPIPLTREQFDRQCRLAQTGVVVPESIRGLTIIQHSWDQLLIRLPPKERIEEFERIMNSEGTGPYNFFPAFYERFRQRDLSVDEKLTVQACRIGDYTISICG